MKIKKRQEEMMSKERNRKIGEKNGKKKRRKLEIEDGKTETGTENRNRNRKQKQKQGQEQKTGTGIGKALRFCSCFFPLCARDWIRTSTPRGAAT
jgi:hypothetical protein